MYTICGQDGHRLLVCVLFYDQHYVDVCFHVVTLHQAVMAHWNLQAGHTQSLLHSTILVMWFTHCYTAHHYVVLTIPL